MKMPGNLWWLGCTGDHTKVSFGCTFNESVQIKRTQAGREGLPKQVRTAVLGLTPFSGWRPCCRQDAAPYSPLAWPGRTKPMCALAQHTAEQTSAAERPNVWRSIFIYLASARPFLLSADAPQFMYWKRLWKIYQVWEKIISKCCECLNIKELTFCSTEYLITISVPATFPEARTHLKNALISRSHWDDFYHRHTAWLFCLWSVPVEPQCAWELGACRQQIPLAVVWSFPFASSHLLLKCTVCKGDIRHSNLVFIV